MIFMCFIKIHKVNSPKYEWSLDLLTVIFDCWIFITNTKGTQMFYSWKVFICFFKIYQVKSSNYEWSLNKLAVIFDRWIFITYTKGTQVLFFNDIHVLYQNPQGELFKVWMVFKYVGGDLLQLFKVWMVFRLVASDIWQLNLYHKQKRDKKFLLMNEYSCVLSESTRWNLQRMNGL